MSAVVISEWAYRISSPFWVSPVRVPRTITSQTCGEPHRFGWLCTRRPGHSGRCAAALDSGEVVAVWTAGGAA